MNGLFWKKSRGAETQLQGANALGDDGLVIGRDRAVRLAEQQGGAVGVGGAPGQDLGADRRQALVDRRRGDRAVRHVQQVEARALAQETDRHRQALARRVEVRRDLGPVAELAGRGHDGRDGKLDAGHMQQELGDLALFPGELGGVRQVLVLAPAAAAEQRAAGRHAVRRGREHFQEISLGEILVVAEHPHPHALAGEGERHHDHPAGGIFVFRIPIFDFRQPDATEAGAEVGKRGNLQLELGVIGERLVVEFLGFGHETHEIHERAGNEDVLFRVFGVFRGDLIP